MNETTDQLQHRLLLSTAEVGILLGVSENKARQIIYEYRLPIVPFMRNIRVPRKAVEDLVARFAESDPVRTTVPSTATIFPNTATGRRSRR